MINNMAVYVDNARIVWKEYLWCHLVADSENELHLFAQRLGLKRCWYQKKASYPHYDITIKQRKMALELGAIEGTRKQIIECAKELKIQLQCNQLSLF